MYGFIDGVPVLKTLGRWRQWAARLGLQWAGFGLGVWMVQGVSALGSSANRNFISNAAFVVTPAGVVVVDALGSPVLAQELIAAIGRVTTQPIRQLIVTHYHADHIYGLQAFKALGATITAHRDGRTYLHSDTARLRLQASREELAPWVDENTQLVPADVWVDAPTRFSLGGVDFVLQPAGPAHTPEDLVVVLPQQGVLIAGDLVFRGRVPFVGGADSGRWIEALQRLLSYKVAVIVPGHGPVSTDEKADLLKNIRVPLGKALAAHAAKCSALPAPPAADHGPGGAQPGAL